MREQDDRGRLTLALRREKEGIAKKLLVIGLSIDDIVEITGLTMDEIEKLNGDK